MTAESPKLRDRVVGPPNPLVADRSGYEHRQLDARSWARGAHLDEDLAALAWALASESPNAVAYPQYARAIGRAIIRDALAEGISVHQRITMEGVLVRGAPVPGAGHYGRQHGRWCASTQWPLMVHLGIARELLAETVDPAGARRWADLRTMDRGVQANQKLELDAEALVRKRWIEGWAWVGPILDARLEMVIDPYVLWLGRRRRPGDELGPALEMVVDGRQRWRWRQPRS